jgi:hypothetical protein
MKFHVWRTACLMEDEGHDHYRGVIDAADESSALDEALRLYGDNYFHRSNFRVLQAVNTTLANIRYDGNIFTVALTTEYESGPQVGHLRDTIERGASAHVLVQRLREMADRIEKAHCSAPQM